MAYNFDGYLTFGTRVDESGFEQGIADLKAAANLGASAIDADLSDVASSLSMVTGRIEEGLQKLIDAALLFDAAGKNSIVQGTAEIERSMSNLEKEMAEFSTEALENAKSKATSYEELGSLYLKAMKAGITGKAKDAIIDMQWFVDANVDAFVLENKKASPMYRKAATELMSLYKEALNSGAEEAYRQINNKISAITEAAQTQYDEIIKQRDRLQNKLSAYGDLFTRDEDGEVKLANIKKQTAALKEYQKAINELMEKGMSEGLLEEIMGLGVVDGKDLAEKLLAKSNAAFEEYNAAWEERQEVAKTIAEAFYAEELETLEAGFVEELDDALFSVIGICQNVGIDAMQGVINGMESRRSDAVATARSIADAIIRELKRATETASPSKRAAREVGAPLTQGIIKGMQEAYDPLEMERYADRMLADVSHAQSRAAQSVSYLSTSHVLNSSSTYNGGDLVLKIEKMVNDGKGSVSSLLQEAELYRRQRASATGGI